MKRNEFSRHIWEYLDQMTNAMLFFFIGLPLFLVFIPGSTIIFFLAPFGVLLASRFIVVYGGWGFLGLFKKRIKNSWKNVLSFGGVRGGIAVALVLSLPVDYEYKALFVSLVGWAIVLNLFVNPILLGTYLKDESLDDEGDQPGSSDRNTNDS
jgi:CPA1 family monovalent cation:H+ antiporter